MKYNLSQYAGSGWLSKYDGVKCSEFGSKVADVLGWVYKGIYHIDKDVLRDRKTWSDSRLIELSVYAPIATWDYSHLTELLFVCYEQNISLEIAGSCNGYSRMLFNDQSPAFSLKDLANSLPDSLNIDELRQLLGMYKPSRERWKYSNSVAISHPGKLSFEEIARLVILAHHNAIRIELRGLSSRSIEVTFHKRSRDGGMWQRHPSWCKLPDARLCQSAGLLRS
jgi:hypothetical protein